MEYTATLGKKFRKMGTPLEGQGYWVNGWQKFLNTSISHKLACITKNNPYLAEFIGARLDIHGNPELRYSYIENAIDLFSWLHYSKFKFNERDLESIFSILFSMSEAIVIFHENLIAHRDVNITNYIVNNKAERPEETIRLADFELTNFFGEANSDFSIDYFNPSSEIDFTSNGTPGYMSYEQASPKSIITQEFDQHSLALTFVHLLTNGAIDIRAANPMEFKDNLTKAIKPIYGEKALKILLKAVGETNEGRYQSVLQFRSALIASIVTHFRILNRNLELAKKEGRNIYKQLVEVSRVGYSSGLSKDASDFLLEKQLIYETDMGFRINPFILNGIRVELGETFNDLKDELLKLKAENTKLYEKFIIYILYKRIEAPFRLEHLADWKKLAFRNLEGSLETPILLLEVARVVIKES